MNTIIRLLIVIVVFGALVRPVSAREKIADSSAHPGVPVEAGEDTRAAQLRSYLKYHGSPMEADASHFVNEADRLGLDWTMVAAIAGVESTFGKHIPRNSYNGWGWGIFTGASDGIHFASWKNGITTVSEGLRFNYMDRGARTVEQIGRIYAASPTWSAKVRFFMEKIRTFNRVGTDTLAVTI